MTNLIVIIGPQAVGKMTVAEKLKERIGYSLMSNHDSIEIALKIFSNNIDYLTELKNKYEKTGGQFYLIELEADIKTRLERNKTPHRLESKPSKKYIEWSDQELIESMNKYRMNSKKNEIKFDNYIKINNTNLTPQDVADIIINKFNLNKI